MSLVIAPQASVMTFARLIEGDFASFVKKTGSKDTFEYVVGMCLKGEAFLGVVLDGKVPIGFTVLAPETASHGERLLCVWIAYSQTGDGMEHIVDNIDLVEDLARASDCIGLKFISPRIGWQKRASMYGFTPSETTYVKALTDGKRP